MGWLGKVRICLCHLPLLNQGLPIVAKLHSIQECNVLPGVGETQAGKRQKGRERVARQQVKPCCATCAARLRRVPDAAYLPKAGAPDKQADGRKQFNRENGKGQRGFAQARAATQLLYAALDLGTNNCRLLIATPQERGKFRVVDGFSRIVRLGEGLAHSGRLSDGAMDRAVEALKICAEKLGNHKISQHRLIATEACRQAVNGEQFLARVKAETGMDLEIIDRETEAYLAAEGCGALMDRRADAAVLFDIGGGSSELILVDCRRGRKRISDQIVSWTSLPIGVVTLAERHGGTDVNGDVFQAMVDEVHGHLSRFEGRDALGRIWQSGQVHLLGTSGTVTTLAGIHLGLPRYERRLVDGLWLASGEIDLVIKKLLAMDYHQRASSPCIGTERADLVMAGCAILEGIRQVWPSERLRVADRGLREGMLTQLMETDSAWLPPNPGKWRKRRFSNTNQFLAQGSSDNSNGNM